MVTASHSGALFSLRRRPTPGNGLARVPCFGAVVVVVGGSVVVRATVVVVRTTVVVVVGATVVVRATVVLGDGAVDVGAGAVVGATATSSLLARPQPTEISVSPTPTSAHCRTVRPLFLIAAPFGED